MGQTSIEWVRTYRPDGSWVPGYTFNPWWGCVEDGPECDHCYARTFARRTGHQVWGHDAERRWFGDLYWREPILWNNKAAKLGLQLKVFCSSMADIGERRNDDIGKRMDDERAKLWPLIARTPNLTWLLLTKRPQNLLGLVPPEWMHAGFPNNVWVGTTAGNQDGWRKRVKYLERMPVVRFVSCEPLLGEIDGVADYDIDWLIAGSESGPGARPAQLDWVRSLRDQCKAASMAFFFKQWTEGRTVIETPELDGRQWNEFPESRAA